MQTKPNINEASILVVALTPAARAASHINAVDSERSLLLEDVFILDISQWTDLYIYVCIIYIVCFFVFCFTYGSSISAASTVSSCTVDRQTTVPIVQPRAILASTHSRCSVNCASKSSGTAQYQCLHSAHTHAVPWRSAQRRLNRFFCVHPQRRPNSSGQSLHASGTGGSSAHLQSLASRGTRDPMLRRRLRGDIPETHGVRLRNYIPWAHGLRGVICMLHCWDSWLWDGALKPEIFTTHVCLLCHDRQINSTLN